MLRGRRNVGSCRLVARILTVQAAEVHVREQCYIHRGQSLAERTKLTPSGLQPLPFGTPSSRSRVMTSPVNGQTDTDHRGTSGGASRSLWSASATVTNTFMRRSKPPGFRGAVKMT